MTEMEASVREDRVGDMIQKQVRLWRKGLLRSLERETIPLHGMLAESKSREKEVINRKREKIQALSSKRTESK